MTLYARKFTTQNINDGSLSEDQYAKSSNALIYIMDEKSKRWTVLKAYLKSFKLNITPAVELEKTIFSINPFLSYGQTLFSYSLTLDVPAANPTEAGNNLAKLQELWRYVGSLTNGTNFSLAQKSIIYFSNLINNCKNDEALFPIESRDPAGAIEANGITGIIKQLKYAPSLDTGFFQGIPESASKEEVVLGNYSPGAQMPKHYELDIELFMVNSHDTLGDTWPFLMGINL